jgi:hypothetical protein
MKNLEGRGNGIAPTCVPHPEDFGVRRQVRRDAALAFGLAPAVWHSKSGVAAALCHRTPKFFAALRFGIEN